MTMKCQICEGRSHLFLCQRCITTLKGLLTDLAGGQQLRDGQRAPGWLEHLREAALGQTRMGETGRYFRPNHAPLRFNGRASELFDYADSVLSEWVLDICEQRGIQWRPLKHVEMDFIGPLPADWRRLRTDYRASAEDKAAWLAEHVSAIASEEGARVAYCEFDEIVSLIKRQIDRPASRRFIGPCPTILDDSGGVHRHGRRCGTALVAQREDTQVQCHVCKATHEIDDVFTQLVEDLGEWSFTAYELQTVVLPAIKEVVPARTLSSWIHTRRLTPSGTNPDGKPVYLLATVRKLRDDKPQKRKTGAAARRG